MVLHSVSGTGLEPILLVMIAVMTNEKDTAHDVDAVIRAATAMTVTLHQRQ